LACGGGWNRECCRWRLYRRHSRSGSFRGDRFAVSSCSSFSFQPQSFEEISLGRRGW
jgi:hypothetical protein